MAHQDFLLLVLADEVTRRDSLATSLRVQRARLDPAMQLELWDSTANVTYDQTLWNELVSLRFPEQHAHLMQHDHRPVPQIERVGDETYKHHRAPR